MYLELQHAHERSSSRENSTFSPPVSVLMIFINVSYLQTTYLRFIFADDILVYDKWIVFVAREQSFEDFNLSVFVSDISCEINFSGHDVTITNGTGLGGDIRTGCWSS